MVIVNDNLNPIDYNREYVSNQYGNFKIIKDLGMINHAHMIRVKFVDSGYEKEVQMNQIKYGNIRDDTIFPHMDLDSNKIYHSNNFGDYRIIALIPKESNNKARRCTIEFIETGYRTDVLYESAKRGSVKDPTYGIDFNKLYETTQSGYCKILRLADYEKSKRVVVEFINTGSIVEARLDHVLGGNVLDPVLIKHCRPGELGDVSCRDYPEFYQRWCSMMARCYNPYDHRKDLYAEISVCERWMIFSNYVYDAMRLPGYEKACRNFSAYNIDKDLIPLLTGCPKIYSPETCVWLTSSDNITIHRSVPHMLSHGCIIIPLQNGDFDCIIARNNIPLVRTIFNTIQDTYKYFLFYLNEKIMCKII